VCGEYAVQDKIIGAGQKGVLAILEEAQLLGGYRKRLEEFQ
jgi:hypothetical protein